jgi:hypothetical protein
MKLSGERGGDGHRRWSLEMTGAAHRAIAALIGVVVLAIAHWLGIDAQLAHAITSIP